MHRDLSRLVRDVDTLSRRLSSVERASNLRHSTLEDGVLRIRDENGDLTATIGVQPDGSTTIDHVQGPPPPVPTTPTVTVDGAVLAVTWDGGFTGGAVAPKDFQGIDVHVSQTTEDIDTPAAILGNLGTDRHNTATIMVDAKGPWHVALAARTLTGAASALTPLVTVEVTTGIVDLEETLAQARQELDQAMQDLQDGLADLNNADLPALRAALDELENVTLPALTADLAENDAAMDQLRNVTLPALQQSLADARAELEQDMGALDTRLGTNESDLATAQQQLNTVRNTTIPALQADLTELEGTTLPALQQGLGDLDGRLTTNEQVVDDLEENLSTALVAINDPTTGLGATATAAQQAQAAADAAREAADAALAGIVSQVENPSFETGNSTGWVNTGVSNIVQVPDARHGYYVARITCDGATNYTIDPNRGAMAAATAGQVWRVGVWLRRTDSTQVTPGTFRLGFMTADDAGQWIHLPSVDYQTADLTSSWQYFTNDWQIPDTASTVDKIAPRLDVRGNNPAGIVIEVDQFELRNVTDSSAALQAAQDALDRANQAHQLAGTADSNADAALVAASAAQSHASTTPRIYHATTVPTGTAPVNSTWWQHQGSLSGNVIGQWTQSASPSGSTWTKSLIGNETIANLDVGKLTAGSAVIIEAVAQKIAAAAGEFVTINADQITAGTIDTARLNAQAVAAAVGSFLSLSASQITSGTIATARLNAEQVAAAIATFLTLRTDQLTVTGSAGFSTAVAEELWAKKLVAGKVLANEVIVGNSGNILANGDFAEGLDGWNSYNANVFTVGTTNIAPYAGMPALSIGYATGNSTAWNDAHPYTGSVRTAASPGDVFRLRMTCRVAFKQTDQTARIAFRLVPTRADGSNITIYDKNVYARDKNAQWETFEWTQKMPADTVKVSIGLLMVGGDGTTAWHVREVQATKMTDASLIVDGAVQARHVEAESVAAAVASFLELSAGQITSGTVATARLNAQEVAAAVGTFLSLRTDQLTANGAGFDQAVVNDLRAKIFTVQKILANEVLIGGSYAVNVDPWVRTYGTPSWPGETKTQFFDSANPWGSTAYALPDAAPTDAAVLRSILDGNDQTLVVDYFEAKAGEQYRITYWMRSGGNRNTGAYNPFIQYWNGTGWALWGQAPSPAYTYTAASPWVKVETGPINTNPLSQDRRLRLVWRHTTAAGTGQMLATGIAVERLVSANLIVDGTIATRHLGANSVDTDALGANAITAKHTITGATVRTSASYPRTEMDNTGLYIYDEDGQQAVALRGDGDHLGLLGADGGTVAALDDEGNLNARGANIAEDPVVMGNPLLGSFPDRQTNAWGRQAWFDMLPWGPVAYGEVSGVGGRILHAGGGSMAMMQLEAYLQSGRAYMFIVDPISVNLAASTWCDLRVSYDDRPAYNPTFTNNVLKRFQVSNYTSGSVAQSVGGTFLIRMPSTQPSQNRKFLLFFTADGGSVTLGNEGRLSASIVDVGPDIPNTGLLRYENDSDPSTPTPTPDPVQNKRDYTKKYWANGSRTWRNGSVRSDNTHYAYQGAVSGYEFQSIQTFPNMTNDLSGAEIISIRAYVEFSHWYYSSGGTLKLMLHGQTGLPSSIPSLTLAKTQTGMPKPGGRWIDIPSSYWAGFKSGTYRGIGLGDDTGSTEEYGYGYWDRFAIEIKYRK